MNHLTRGTLKALVIASLMGLGGCNEGVPVSQFSKIEFRLAETEPADGLEERQVYDSERVVYLRPEVILTNADILTVSQSVNESGGLAISIQLTPEGGEKLAAATRANLQKQMALVIDNTVMVSLTIREEIHDRVEFAGPSDLETERLYVMLVAQKVERKKPE